MKTNPLLSIKQFGQSVWLDDIHRGLLNSDEFKRIIYEDGISGVTSNPAILEKGIVEHSDYDEVINTLAATDATSVEIYEQLAVEDLRCAADLLRPIYDETKGLDGFVSFEVSPHIAYKTDTTVSEAKRLRALMNRPNTLIKVPATRAGVPAIQKLIADNVNINATLLFSLERYRQVAEAFIAGLQARAGAGHRIDGIVSVASFFVSRIDILVDQQLDALVEADPSMRAKAQAIRGQTAVASARLAFQDFKTLFSGPRWEKLAAVGAKPQRLLWASTGTKNTLYSDVKYIEELIGPKTVTTVPLKTLAAYRDHGQPAHRLDQNPEQSNEILTRLAELGIGLANDSEQLEREGVDKFIVSFDKLIQILEQRRPSAKNPTRK